jgi:hypothetical protein
MYDFTFYAECMILRWLYNLQDDVNTDNIQIIYIHNEFMPMASYTVSFAILLWQGQQRVSTKQIRAKDLISKEQKI